MKTVWKTSSASCCGSRNACVAIAETYRAKRSTRASQAAASPLRQAATSSASDGPASIVSAMAGRLMGLSPAKALGEDLEKLPGNVGPRLDERPEAPDRQRIRHHRRRRRHRCRPGGLVDERDLAERRARAERADGLALHGHCRLTALDDEEVEPVHALCRDGGSLGEMPLDELGGEPLRGLVVEVGEEG